MTEAQTAKSPRMTWKERLEAARNRIERTKVDFNAVPPSQYKIHDRLENWARWNNGRTARDEDTSPMFRLHRSDEWENYERRGYGSDTLSSVYTAVDKLDAVAVHKGVAALPEKHRKAINWKYLDSRDVRRKCQELAVSHQGLADLIKDARTMLINRKV